MTRDGASVLIIKSHSKSTTAICSRITLGPITLVLFCTVSIQLMAEHENTAVPAGMLREYCQKYSTFKNTRRNTTFLTRERVITADKVRSAPEVAAHALARFRLESQNVPAYCKSAPRRRVVGFDDHVTVYFFTKYEPETSESEIDEDSSNMNRFIWLFNRIRGRHVRDEDVYDSI